MNGETIYVTKGNGDRVPFDENKLRTALENSGAGINEVDKALAAVKKTLYQGISTRKIYQTAYRILKKSSRHSAGRYRLKKAIMELGPSGYPFEKFMGRIMESRGYRSLVNQHIQGKCVEHEVDVVAVNDREQVMIECKYHSDSKRNCDVKVVLYIESRFRDVAATWKKAEPDSRKSYYGMVATNTRFSEDAIRYAECAGLRLVSWDYPAGNSLKNWIDRSGYHPITSLSQLKTAEKQFLLGKGIVLCRDIKDNVALLEEMGLCENRKSKVLAEAKLLAGGL
jgi:Holliday junction resolvase-like predicted endonuclease